MSAAEDSAQQHAAQGPRFARVVDVSSDLLEPIKAYLSACALPFRPSMLYDAGQERKFQDPARRLSEFRAIVDPRLFDLAEKVVARLSDAAMSFKLVRNDCTHIKYDVGGFFKKHQDYLSLTSNMIEEFTLIICITPEDLAAKARGGRTIIHWGPPPFSTAYKATTTPGKALLFRKDLMHEGEVLSAGGKEIFTLNLWGSRIYAGPVLQVRFPPPSPVNPPGMTMKGAPAAGVVCPASKEKRDARSPPPKRLKKSSAAACAELVDASSSSSAAAAAAQAQVPFPSASEDLQAEDLQVFQAAMQTKSYAIAVEQVQGTMLATVVEWALRNAESADEVEPTCITYDCTFCTYEEFQPIFRILTYQRVTENSIIRSARLLDYFGPFPRINILVDYAAADGGYADDDADSEHQKDGGGAQGDETDSDDEEHLDALFDELMSGHVIVCESSQRTTVVSNLAKVLGLPYVRFRMIFCEGDWMFTSGEQAVDNTGRLEDDVRTLPLTTAFASIGEYEHILCMRTLNAWLMRNSAYSAAPPSLRELHTLTQTCVASLPQQVRQTQSEYSPGDFVSCCGQYRESKDEPNVHPPAKQKADGTTVWTPPTLPRRMRIGDLYPRYADRAPLGMLKLAPTTTPFSISDLMQDERDVCLFEMPPECVYLPGKGDEAAQGDEAAHFAPGTWLFHHDPSGKVCFTKAEAEAASEHLAKIDLESLVQASVNRMRFQLPQQNQSQDVTAMFCNESVYGRFNILEVTGVVRLQQCDDEGAEVAATACDIIAANGIKHGDVWPTWAQTQSSSADVFSHAYYQPDTELDDNVEAGYDEAVSGGTGVYLDEAEPADYY